MFVYIFYMVNFYVNYTYIYITQRSYKKSKSRSTVAHAELPGDFLHTAVGSIRC